MGFNIILCQSKDTFFYIKMCIEHFLKYKNKTNHDTIVKKLNTLKLSKNIKELLKKKLYIIIIYCLLILFVFFAF